jgi:tRNA (guanine-N7-)-methyltransferase
MGFEIRDTIVEYVGKKIRALRLKENKYENIAVLRTNSMRHLTNYIRESQLEKIFICFPDPNFKKSKHNRRIVNLGFLSEYAYCLKNGGKLYCITDVKELHDWHVEHLDKHSLFRKISDEDMKKDVCYQEMFNKTEEGQKVERNKGDKFACIYECIKLKN